MVIFLIVCFICGLFSSLHLLSKLAEHFKILQETCSDLFHEPLAAAFVCGSDITNAQSKNLFRASGLIHLMVVSGGHLQIIEAFLLALLPEKWLEHKLGRWGLVTCLVSYSLITGFQPPVVRALTTLLLRFASLYFRWNLGGLQIVSFAGLLLLSLQPDWIFNFSFYLSWLASLGLLLAPWCFLKARKESIKQKIIKFWFSTFCVQALIAFAFSAFSILGLVMNALVAPILAIVLLPLSLLTLVSQWGPKIFAALVQSIEWVVNAFGARSTGDYPQSLERWLGLWIFVALLHGILWSLQRQRYFRTPL